jgi:hypothetical protein
MATHILRQIRTALRHLNPNEVRRLAQRPLSIGLAARSSKSVALMEDFLAPPDISPNKRLELAQILHRVGDPGVPAEFDLEICEDGLSPVPGAFLFRSSEPERTVREILLQREDLSLVLARSFPPFRKPVIGDVIQEISRENTLFALLTALPNAVPSVFTMGWAAGEFASDTTVLTVNQVRMAFLIAAASDHAVGYFEQKTQIASIIAGAFGWRALARELVGKIPFGAGLIPKAAVAYAGTFVVGLSLERFYRIGYGYTPSERRVAYEQALENGKRLAKWLLGRRQGATEAG